MEHKLHTAAASLPTPDIGFDTIHAEARHRKMIASRFSIRRAAILAAALALVFTFTAAGYRYTQIQRSMWVLYYQHDWDDAQNAIDDFGLTLPRELNGYAFVHQMEYSVVPRGTGFAQAMLTDFYHPIGIDYGHFAPSEHSLPQSVPEIDEWGPSIDIGSTNSPYWKTYFSINEDGLVDHENVVPGSTRIVAYNGIPIQLYQTAYHDSDSSTSSVYAHALWVDEARECCILLDIHAPDMDLALATAQTLINTNP